MIDAALGGLSRLNDRQRAAATWGAGTGSGGVRSAPLLIIAGAGTGKTATLAHRVAWLVTQGVDPNRILLLTFSRRAAQEMTHRAGHAVAQALQASTVRTDPHAAPQAASQTARLHLPWAGTFHAMAVRMLRLHAEELGLDPHFGVLDRSDAADLIDLLRQERGLSASLRRFPKKDACLAIASFAVNTGCTLREALSAGWPWCLDWHDVLRGLLAAYAERKQAHGVLDFDDLLLAWDAAMAEPSVAVQMAARFDHVLVDEYQDTNLLQARILRGLCPDGQGLVAVGDDAQAIYAFRGACVDNMLSFPAQFDPPAACITLERSYRSVQPVLDTANALIEGASSAYPKRLQAVRHAGARPQLWTVADEREQADRVIDAVLAQREAGVPLKRQAVLFRSAHHSEWLEVELTRRNIPFVKHGGLRFMDAAHVKDVVAVLRWAEQPRDRLAGFRVLQCVPGMGPARAEQALAQCVASQGLTQGLASFAAPAAGAAVWSGLLELLARIEPREARWRDQLAQVCSWYQPVLAHRHRRDAAVRAADLDMLTRVAASFGSRERFLTDLALDPPAAAGDLSGAPLRDEDYLILSTVHSAKGQEWDAVWILNVTDGNFPNEYATGDPAGIDEERRLLYVAMTRARDSLALIEPRAFAVTHQPRLGDRHVTGARSRFLDDAVIATLDCLEPVARDAMPAQPTRASADASGLHIGPPTRTPDPAPAEDDNRRVKLDLAARLRQRW
jgi:DNA helicase-2/ATP-dependent DNA helicase PcrA